MHDRSVFWFGTDTAIKTSGVKPLTYSRASSFVRHHIIVYKSPRGGNIRHVMLI
jgi:hypothetical protein